MQSSLAPRGLILCGFANSLDRPKNKNASHTRSLQWIGEPKLFDNSNGFFGLPHDIQGVEGKKSAVPHHNVSAKLNTKQ